MSLFLSILNVVSKESLLTACFNNVQNVSISAVVFFWSILHAPSMRRGCSSLTTSALHITILCFDRSIECLWIALKIDREYYRFNRLHTKPMTCTIRTYFYKERKLKKKTEKNIYTWRQFSHVNGPYIYR